MRLICGFLLLVLIWGSTWAAIRISVEHLSVLSSVALRFDIATVVACFTLALSGGRLPTWAEWKLLVPFSFFLTVIPFTLIAWSSHHTTTGLTSVLFATSPLIVAAMEYLMRRDEKRPPIDSSRILGSIGGLAGILTVLYGTIARGRMERRGILVILFVVLVGSYVSIVAKNRLHAIPPLTLTATVSAVTGITLSLCSLVIDRHHSITWDPASVMSMLFLGLFSSAMGHALFFWLLQNMQPYQLAARYFLMPLVALAEGKYLLGEEVSFTTVAGTLLILPSLMLVLRPQSTSPVKGRISM